MACHLETRPVSRRPDQAEQQRARIAAHPPTTPALIARLTVMGQAHNYHRSPPRRAALASPKLPPGAIFPIAKGIPIPPARSGRTGPRKPKYTYPWRLLEVGDSFFVPGVLVSDVSYRAVARKLGREFVARSVCEGDLFGVRFWRTA